MIDINKTLEDREKTHGDFVSHALISQRLCYVMRDANTATWHALPADKRESLEMIQHKIARILNGNPETHDHWHDIAGYATLIANKLKEIKHD